MNVPEQDEALLRDAVDALLGIAWEQAPPETARSLRAQLDELGPEECEQLLRGMVDTETLRVLIDGAEQAGAEPELPSLEEEQMLKVDAALEPLAKLTSGAAGAERVGRLTPASRARILFSSLGRRP